MPYTIVQEKNGKWKIKRPNGVKMKTNFKSKHTASSRVKGMEKFKKYRKNKK